MIEMFIRYSAVMFYVVCFVVFLGGVGFWLLDYLVRKEIGEGK